LKITGTSDEQIVKELVDSWRYENNSPCDGIEFDSQTNASFATVISDDYL
jgi:hypothetical protein